jgi:hypothetical protein
MMRIRDWDDILQEVVESDDAGRSPLDGRDEECKEREGNREIQREPGWDPRADDGPDDRTDLPDNP